VFVAATGCGSAEPIVGRWQDEDYPDHAMEFFADGTVMIVTDMTVSGKWEYLADQRLRVSSTVLGTEVLKVYSLTFDGEPTDVGTVLSLTDERGETKRYERTASGGAAAATQAGAALSLEEKTYRTDMKRELVNLTSAEEAHFADHVAYTTQFPTTVYYPAPGIIGPTITLTADGWTGYVGHTLTTTTCAIFIGTTGRAPAVNEGEPRCAP